MSNRDPISLIEIQATVVARCFWRVKIAQRDDSPMIQVELTLINQPEKFVVYVPRVPSVGDTLSVKGHGGHDGRYRVTTVEYDATAEKPSESDDDIHRAILVKVNKDAL